jgi:hypothetical protein
MTLVRKKIKQRSTWENVVVENRDVDVQSRQTRASVRGGFTAAELARLLQCW